MDTIDLEIRGIKLLKPKRLTDERGFFFELFRRRSHPDVNYIQDNVSSSMKVGTVRGLHYQAPPFAQAKLVTLLQGAIFDVALDMRLGSPTFGRWAGAELSAENMQQLFIPAGFAHGFCTLEPNTLVLYKVDNYYSANHDRGILWNDPALGIEWPVSADAAVLSDKDRALPLFSSIETAFPYERLEPVP